MDWFHLNIQQGKTHANSTIWITVRFRNEATCLHVSSLEEQFLGKTHRMQVIFKQNCSLGEYST